MVRVRQREDGPSNMAPNTMKARASPQAGFRPLYPMSLLSVCAVTLASKNLELAIWLQLHDEVLGSAVTPCRGCYHG